MALDTAKITLPKTVVTNIINKASGVSTIAALSQSQPQLFADATHMVFSPSSEAEIVGEGKTKGSYEQAFTPVPAKIVKLVTTTRTTDELKYADEDNRLEILKLIQQDQLGALARGLDYAVYHGVSAKSGTKVTELTPLTDGAVSVTATTDQAANIDALADAVMDYDINGVALSRIWASALRKVRVTSTGARMFPEIPLNLDAGNLDGINAKTSNTVNGVRCQTATNILGIMGDFNLIKWGMVRDATAEIIEYGDPDGTGVDLKANGQIAYRTESIIGFSVLDPKGFAVLKSVAA